MATFGDTSYGSSSFPGNEDRALVSPFVAPEAGTIDAIWVYGVYIAPGGRLKGIVHADASGAPAALVAASAQSAVLTVSGWVRLAVSGSPAFSSGATYWIGVVGSGFENDYGDDTSGGPGMVMANGTYSFATPPSWPGTDASYSGYSINAYVEYTPAGGGDVSAALTGQALASARGTAGITHDQALTGQVLASTGGSLGVDHAQPLTGQAIVTAQGAVGVSIVIGLTGQQMTLSQGILSAGGDVTLALTGQMMASAFGTLLPQTAVGLTGLQLVDSFGLLIPGSSVPISGQQGLLAEGILVPSISGGNVTVALNGQQMTFAQGTISVFGFGGGSDSIIVWMRTRGMI